jgi:ADP-ribose pyrophosphatase
MKPGVPIKILGQGRYVRLVDRRGWEFIDQPDLRGIVVIVAVTPENKLLLVEQYRPPLDARIIELPAGMVGDHDGGEHETFETAATRELEEETGYTAKRMEKLTAGPASPGRSSFIYSFFRARDLTRIHEGGGDEFEDIVVHEAPLEKIHEWLSAREREGKLIDPKIWAGLHFIGRFP